ncbi:LysE family translocator [Acuticoccus kandeliae]|uniref:LysE family translocator n=1 Tax=Acuticoccus kandeliae TaxID=2073160 RepID=UPI000D3ED550|nr:LysE family translocator [Acuticoccus kandeliae]
MDTGWLAGVLGFAFAMAATPGPNNTIAAASGARHGMARSLPLMAGIAVGVASIMLATAAFGASLVADPAVGRVLKWAGIVYLSWLAWTIANATPSPVDTDGPGAAGTAPTSFAQGAFLQLVNPKLWVMVGGAVVTYGGAEAGAGRVTLSVLFALIFGGMTFASTLAWAALGASIGRFLATRRAMRAFNILMAALLLASLVPVLVG